MDTISEEWIAGMCRGMDEIKHRVREKEVRSW